MASKTVIMAASAFTTREKLNILVNEGNIRLRNHSPHISWELKRRDLDRLMIQMQEYEHSEEFPRPGGYEGGGEVLEITEQSQRRCKENVQE